MTRVLHILTLVRDLACITVSYLFLWWWGIRGAAVGGKIAHFVQLLPGMVLLAPLVIVACEVGARRLRRRWLAGLIVFLLAPLLFAFGVQFFIAPPDLTPITLTLGALPAVVAVIVALWLSESAILGGISHGILALFASCLFSFGPFVLDRYFSETTDIARMTEERDVVSALSLPLVCAGELELDLLRAPKVYTSYRLGEGVFRYPDVHAAIRANLLLAAVLAVFGYLIPARLRRVA